MHIEECIFWIPCSWVFHVLKCNKTPATKESKFLGASIPIVDNVIPPSFMTSTRCFIATFYTNLTQLSSYLDKKENEHQWYVRICLVLATEYSSTSLQLVDHQSKHQMSRFSRKKFPFYRKKFPKRFRCNFGGWYQVWASITSIYKRFIPDLNDMIWCSVCGSGDGEK